MKKYLIFSPHNAEDCSKVVKQTLAIGYLTHFYWGCKSGDHTGYAILEAENEQEALLSIPTMIREKGKAVGIVQFDPREVDSWKIG